MWPVTGERTVFGPGDKQEIFLSVRTGVPIFRAACTRFIVRVAPARSQTTNYEFNDSHFHLTNNIQKGPTIRDFLNMMGNNAGLPGFDQDHYARYSEANQRDSSDLLDEFSLVRRSTIAFFKSLDAAALLRTGVANGQRVSVRALAYHIAGHESRHMSIIRERYLEGDLHAASQNV
jgi:hypothetical protein